MIRIRCPGRPPPPGTGSGGAAQRGHAQRGGHPELGVAAEHRHVVSGGGLTQAGQDASRERGVPGPDRVEQPGRGGAHRGQVVDVDQHRAPARPLRVALHHGRDDRVAGRDHVGTGYRRPVVAAEPGPARGPPAAVRPMPPSPASSPPSGLLVVAASPARRPIGHRISTCGRPATLVGRTGCQPSWRKNRSWRRLRRWRRTAAPRPARRARRPPGPGPRPPARAVRRRVDHQPPAVPPADVRAGTGRAEPDPADHRAVRCPRHQHYGARVVVAVVGVAGLEQVLLGRRTPACAAPGRPPARPGRRPARSRYAGGAPASPFAGPADAPR